MREQGEKIVCRNREASRHYEFEDRFEAGMVLLGTEVKSLRAGRIQLKDSYCDFKNGELFLISAHISPYEMGTFFNHPPERPRKLLLKKQELKKLYGRVAERGFTIVPLTVYFKNGLAKLEIALARGKKTYDRREEIKMRDLNRELQREAKHRKR